MKCNMKNGTGKMSCIACKKPTEEWYFTGGKIIHICTECAIKLDNIDMSVLEKAYAQIRGDKK